MVKLADRDKEFRFSTNREILEIAKKRAKENGLNLSKTLDRIVKQIAITGSIEVMDEKELERQMLIQEIQSEVKKGVDSIEAGRGISLGELRESFGL